MPIKQLSNWSEPKISPKNTTAKNVGHHCYVWFRFYDQENHKWSNPIRRKPALPSICSKEDHYLELKALKQAIVFKLQVQGWNPLNDTYAVPVHVPVHSLDFELKKIKDLTFNDALTFAFNKKKKDWSTRTGQCFEGVIKYLKQAAEYVELNDKKICEFRLPHYRVLLETVKELRKLSNSGFNKYREYLSSLITELIQWEVVELNLVHHVQTKQAVKRFAHRPPTKDEQTIIMQRIIKDHFPYYRFLAVLYGCTLRPKEITRLKIKHLHKKEHVFRIPYSASEENLKTKADREVMIPVWVMDLLMGMNLQNYNPEYYIFSTFNKYRSFMPGPNAMHPNTTHHTWRKIVKDKETGLGLDVNQYSLKKLSGNDMVKMQMLYNTDKLLQLPQMQMGHANQKQTTDYVQEHLEVMKDLVKHQMPVL